MKGASGGRVLQSWGTAGQGAHAQQGRFKVQNLPEQGLEREVRRSGLTSAVTETLSCLCSCSAVLLLGMP